MKAKTLVTVLAVAFLICYSGAGVKVMAQLGGNGGIQGTVTDPGGAVVPNATVVATNVATNVETNRQTNDAGLYVIKPLPPGEYKVVVTKTGFLTLIQEKIVVDALSTVAVNVSLKVGDVKESVTVTDAPTQLNTSDPRLGTTIRSELYTNLPLAMGDGSRRFRYRAGAEIPALSFSFCPESPRAIAGGKSTALRDSRRMSILRARPSPTQFNRVKAARLVWEFQLKRLNNFR
jgi:hypothetical protein